MKKFPYLLIICCLFLQAQAQTKECAEKTRAIGKLLEDKKYTEAYELWGASGKCAVANDTIFEDGEKILLYRITHTTPPEEKQKATDALFKLYADYDKAFPGNAKANPVKKALFLFNNKLGTPEEIFSLLDRAFKNDAANFRDPRALYVYFDLYFKQYSSGSKAVKEEDVFEMQDVVLAKIGQLSKMNPAQARNYKSVADGIRGIVAPIVSCDKLISFYSKNFESKKTDTLWLANTAQILTSKNCSTSAFFLSLANHWYELSPNAKSAYNLGVASLRNKNAAKAMEYFNKAADLEKNPVEKSKIYYTIAATTGASNEVAIGYLKKSAAANPVSGKPYLLMAQLYASASDCGQTPFEKKALYFLAAQTAQKASVEKLLKSAAASQSEAYLKKAPTKAEIKQAKKSGKKVTYKCWINESVTIPEL